MARDAGPALLSPSSAVTGRMRFAAHHQRVACGAQRAAGQQLGKNCSHSRHGRASTARSYGYRCEDGDFTIRATPGGAMPGLPRKKERWGYQPQQ